jgi:hypothetical protein
VNEADDDSSPGLRAPATRALITVASVTALIIGGVYLAIDRLHAPSNNAVEHPGPAATDVQTQTEVVEHARDIVAITRLRQPTAGYLLMSCKNRDDPPYQGAVYMDFELPPDVDADPYFRGVSAALVARGWREGLPPNQHMFGRNLSKDGVNAILYPDRDTPTRGVARIYGQCHDMSDHRGSKAEWTDITARLH